MEVAVLMTDLIFAIFAPVAARPVQFAISRRRELLADASAVELTRYPEGLASALQKIILKNQGEMDASESVSHVFLADPKHSPLDELYVTHLPIEERIRRLRAI